MSNAAFTGFYDRKHRPILYGQEVCIDFSSNPHSGRLKSVPPQIATVERIGGLKNGIKCRVDVPEFHGYVYYDDMDDPTVEDLEIIVA